MIRPRPSASPHPAKTGRVKPGATALRRNERGAGTVEFALIAPVLVMTLMGLFDFSYNMYAETMIEGAVQKAARDSTIETYAGNSGVMDARVTNAVRNVVPGAAVTFERSAYTDYRDIGRGEDFTDFNEDGTCNDGEPFEDANGNGSWDTNRGSSETGGARDAVLYEVHATYDRAFPLAGLLGFPEDVTVSARTVLRNQPYSTQDEAGVGACP